MSDELQSGPKGNEQPENLLALNLGIGDALQMQDSSVSNRAPNRRYYVKLIGFLNKASIVVSHPMQDETLLAVEDGKNFLVRGFSGRKAYEFNANVLFSSHIPYPHLHLSFPKQIECLTMRGALRIQPKLASWIETMDAASAPIKVPAVMVDLSTSGARVHANRQFGKVGDEVRVAFHLPIDDEEQVFSISAVIRNSYNETLTEDLGGAEVMTHGLEFIQPVGVMRMALQNFIYKTMAEG
jgi:c-di-GMP-binding flagellar brake protein YcgR